MQEFKTMLDQKKAMSCLFFVGLVQQFCSMDNPKESFEDVRNYSETIDEADVNTCSEDEENDLTNFIPLLDNMETNLKEGKLTKTIPC